MTVSIYIPIKSVKVFNFLHRFINMWFFFCFVFLIIAILIDIRWYFIVILILFMWLVMLNTFAHTCYPFVCCLWRNIYSGTMPICLNWIAFSAIDLHEFFTYFGFYNLITVMICIYFLPNCWLPLFYYLFSMLCRNFLA
jgi:hypothetical protein